MLIGGLGRYQLPLKMYDVIKHRTFFSLYTDDNIYVRHYKVMLITKWINFNNPYKAFKRLNCSFSRYNICQERMYQTSEMNTAVLKMKV